MKMVIRSIAIMGIIMAMAAATALAQSKPSAVSPPHESVHEKSSLTVTADYIIGPEDVLEISVWRNADLSKIVEVRPDGRISLPLIGDVIAVGRTASQLADMISVKLKEYKEADKDISSLANRLLIFEQQNVEEMKKFL